MSRKFVITSSHNQQKFNDVSFKGAAVKYEFDFRPWSNDVGGSVTGVTWEVVSGNGSVSGASLTDGVATALVTMSDQGGVLVKVTASTASSGVYVAFLDVLVKDILTGTDDYGLTV